MPKKNGSCKKKMGLAKLSIFYFSFYTWFSRIRKVLTKQWIAFFFMIVFLLYIFFKYFILVLITSSALVRACFCGNTVKHYENKNEQNFLFIFSNSIDWRETKTIWIKSSVQKFPFGALWDVQNWGHVWQPSTDSHFAGDSVWSFKLEESFQLQR